MQHLPLIQSAFLISLFLVGPAVSSARADDLRVVFEIAEAGPEDALSIAGNSFEAGVIQFSFLNVHEQASSAAQYKVVSFGIISRDSETLSHGVIASGTSRDVLFGVMFDSTLPLDAIELERIEHTDGVHDFKNRRLIARRVTR